MVSPVSYRFFKEDLENSRVRNIDLGIMGEESRSPQLDPKTPVISDRNQHKYNIIENACGGVACRFAHKRTKKL